MNLSGWTRTLVWIGGGIGLVMALALAGVRAANSSEPLDPEGILGDIAFGVIYVMPFALSLWALRWENAPRQAAAWLAGGSLGFLASFTAFSGVSLVFLPTAPLLLLAGSSRAANVVGAGGLRSALPVLPMAGALAAVGVVAFFVLLTLTSDPRCWVLERFADGQTAWERDPASEAGMIITRGPNGETSVMGSGEAGGPSVNGVQRISSTCTSDVISPIESAASVGMWALAVLGLTLQRPARIRV